MQVCMIVHHYPPRHQAGVELIARRAARWLKQQQYGVEVVCVESIDTGRPGLQSKSAPYEGIPVHRLSFDLACIEDPFRASYDNALIGAWVKTYLEQTRPDLVHVQSCYLTSASPLQAAHDLQIPTVLSLHDYWTICPWMTLQRPDGSRCSGSISAADCAWCLLTEKRRYRLPDIVSKHAVGNAVKSVAHRCSLAGWEKRVAAVADRRRAIAKILPGVDQLTVSSQFLQDSVAALYGMPRERRTLITYGLDPGGWPSGAQIATDGILRLGYIGQLSPQKGVHLLIKAFNRLKVSDDRAQLKIYGDPSEQPRYVRALRRMAAGNTSITFEGRFDNSRIDEVLQGIDALVVPSQWYETGPLVTWEAFASGTPVVATDLPNMKHQIRHQVDGLLFAPDESEDLARQLQRLVDEPGLIQELSKNIDPVKTHEEEMAEMVNVYQQALHTRDRGAL